MINFILKYLKKKYPRETQRLGNALLAKIQTDINIDFCNDKQPKVLICYANIFRINFSYPQHANIMHYVQMIQYFIKNGYCIDLCYYAEKEAFNVLKNKKYNVIIGQGEAYKYFCKETYIPVRINFITENHPLTVIEKYRERLDYFKERHPHINPNMSISRTGVIDVEQFKISTHGILMNSNYNALNFREFKFLRKISSNAIFDKKWTFKNDIILDAISISRNNILWFGSKGLIHKGLDILIDAVKDMPIYLNCYGIQKNEYDLFNKLKAPNIYNKGHINVLSNSFIDEVVLKHNFIIFPSCSEGMNTAVATCMAYGIIPIVTKECGFEPADCILELDDYHVDSIKTTILYISNLSDMEIFNFRQQCYKYAREHFTLNNFDRSFKTIMDEILHNQTVSESPHVQ